MVIPMQVTYTTTLDDFVALNRHVSQKSSDVRISFLMRWLFPPMIGVALALVLGVLYDLSSIAWFVIAVSIVYALIYPSFSRVWIDQYIRKHLKPYEKLAGKTTMILGEESLTVINEIARSEMKWKDIERVDVNGDYTFIFLVGKSAAILPKHGFESIKDYEEARDLALAKVADRNDPQPTE
jgi:YcxB-like protein